MDSEPTNRRQQTPVQPSLARRRRRNRGACDPGRALVGLLLALAAGPAGAGEQTRDVSLRWRAAAGPVAEGFVVVVGDAPRDYQRVIPVGLPTPVDGVYQATVGLPAQLDQYLALLAFNSAGLSPPSNERLLPALASEIVLRDAGATPIIALGHAGPKGVTPLVDLAGGLFQTTGAPTAGRQLAWCNIDGDDAADLLLGQGPGGAGEVVVILGALGVPVAVLSAGVGAGRPACGDLDGDGRDEIAVGLAGTAAGHLKLFDDARTGFAPLVAPPLDAYGRLAPTPWPDGAIGDGDTTPAFGDLDGDGRDEIVIGWSRGSGGHVRVLDDLVAGLAPLDVGPIREGWLATGILDTALWPAAGDYDADGRDEIVIGFDTPGAGSWVRLVDDPIERTGLSPEEGWLQIVAPGGPQGASHPSLGDLDGDGAAELIVGFDDAAVLRVFTDLGGTPRPFGEDPSGEGGWIALAAHDLTGPVFPAVYGPTRRVGLPRILLTGGPIGATLAWVRLDGRTGAIAAGDIASALPVRATGCNATGASEGAELITTLGPGGESRGRLAFLDDESVIQSFPLDAGPADYAAANGELRPACGDVDGDGLDEVIFGPGPGGNGTIWVHEDAYRLIRPWSGAPAGAVQWTDWGSYLLLGGGARPAAGDLDGDGRDEIVIGLDLGGGGWLHVRDDATTGFAPMEAPGLIAGWLHWSNDAAYIVASGASRPTLGDVDGDGLDEIAIGVDAGGGGHVALFDDAPSGFRKLTGPPSTESGIRIPGVGDGSTHPLLLDVDGDGLDELVVGFGAGGTDRIYVADDALAGFGPHPATPLADGFIALPPGLPAPVLPAAGAP